MGVSDFVLIFANTQKDAQPPLPRIDETLDALDGGCYFSNLRSSQWLLAGRAASKKQGKDHLCYSFWILSVSGHALWVMQCPCYISKVNGTSSSWIALVILFSVS